ncbi:TPA_asm: N [Artemisia alphacytorhabdovirus 1]|nr:TPA_asm: N [Artemisia alphacytorhabdovirus 1]
MSMLQNAKTRVMTLRKIPAVQKLSQKEILLRRRAPRSLLWLTRLMMTYADYSVGKRVSREWTDGDVVNVPLYKVTRVDAGQIMALGRDLLTQISSGVINSTTVDICLVLAVSLPKPAVTSFEHMLQPPDFEFKQELEFNTPSGGSTTRKGLSKRDETMLKTSKERITTMEEGDEKTKLADLIKKLEDQEAGGGEVATTYVPKEGETAAYCFLAASLLKLYAKSVEVFETGIKQMQDRFAAWYDCKTQIVTGFKPTTANLNTLRTCFSRRPEILSTWTMWVAYNENRKPSLLVTQQGLLNYLACQQFSYPGMHAYTLLIEIHEMTGMKFNELLKEMDCPATRTAVKEVFTIIKNFEVTKKHPSRTTYFRYARNWDPHYFGALQSTQCKTLVYVAASISKQISTQASKGDPMEIYAIKDMDATIKSRLDPVATTLVHKLLDVMLKDAMSGSAWIQG